MLSKYAQSITKAKVINRGVMKGVDTHLLDAVTAQHFDLGHDE